MPTNICRVGVRRMGPDSFQWCPAGVRQVGIRTQHPGILQRSEQWHRAASIDHEPTGLAVFLTPLNYAVGKRCGLGREFPSAASGKLSHGAGLPRLPRLLPGMGGSDPLRLRTRRRGSQPGRGGVWLQLGQVGLWWVSPDHSTETGETKQLSDEFGEFFYFSYCEHLEALLFGRVRSVMHLVYWY